MMSIKSETIKQSSFYLHSNKNRRLYPVHKYPLTHFLDNQNLERRLSKQPSYVKHFKYTFLLLLSLILFCTILFQTHIYIYNSIFGPFHLNLNQFIEHVKHFENGQSWFKKIEFIQIEIGENNIINPIDSYDVIKRYSDPFTRRHHIATYKKIRKPNLYIKLPVRSQNHFHIQHPFHFPSYSIRTLKCIVKNLQLNSEITLIEKSEYIKYINEEYSKNATLFNKLVLTKCGILIGYLYRPIYEKAFIPTKEYKFNENDIAFDMTRSYYRFYYIILIGCLIVIWLMLKALFYLIIYLLNIIRFKVFYKYGFLSFSLELKSDVLDELWLLNIDEYPHKQLLQLDELIQQTQYKFNNELFIIQNEYEQLFVVVFQLNPHEKLHLKYDFSPFNICPVTDIRKIVQYGGICYGEDLSWIPWPTTTTEEENYSEWLHAQLLELSEHYKNQYEYRLQHEQENENRLMWISPWSSHNSTHRNIRRRCRRTNPTTPYDNELEKLIREEKNIQRFKLERLQFIEYLIDRITPASPQFIANFRMEQKTNQNFIDSNILDEQTTCRICLEEFQIGETYSKWPCNSNKAHIFHSDCMLKTLRMKNTCPICRHPIPSGEVRDNFVAQFFGHLVF